MKLFLFLTTVIFLFASFDNTANKKTILIIFPHPDDETAIGDVLARYASTHTIQIIFAVNPPKDTIVPIRQKEAICSCEQLGIEKPIFLPYDRLDARDGPREYFNRINALNLDLKKRIEQINPDIIITHGPDGESGHFEHRIIGSLVSQIILREGWYEKYPIYYLAEPTFKTDEEQKGGTSEVDMKYINVSIKYTDEDEKKCIKAYACHKSQYNQLEHHIAEKLADTTNTTYLRKLHVSFDHRTDLFK